MSAASETLALQYPNQAQTFHSQIMSVCSEPTCTETDILTCNNALQGCFDDISRNRVLPQALHVPGGARALR